MQPSSLSQWNFALVTALFLRPDRARTTLSRIDVTGRMLVELSGGQDRISAKQSFLKAFGNDPRHIKEQFTLSPRIAVLTKRDGIPPNFAALYLSLLAASADDDTFREGNFRMRFAALLEIDDLETFTFVDLPALWKQFSLWSKSRAASVGDCAVLILPDPQHETRIGHAKRLAFPSYKDEIHLRSALAGSGVDSRDPFHAVSRAAHETLGKFSETFKNELREFRVLVNADRLQEAYDSPFWGAVRDITREEEEKGFAQFGRLCVQVDIADPQFPELSVLADERASLALGRGQTVRLPRARGPYVAAWAGASLEASISVLLSLAEKDKAFARSRLGVALRAGCLPFFLDSLGSLSSDGRYFENGPCCLLMRSGAAQRIRSLASHVGLPCTEMGTEENTGPWTFLCFSAVSGAFMARLALEVPTDAQKLFAQGWVRALPRIAGAARYGQAVLLTPASNPFVRLEGAVTGQYAILDSAGIELAAGPLRTTDDGFYIPPFQLVGVEGHSTCRFSLQVPGSGVSHFLEVPVVDGAPSAPLKEANRDGWLIDGRLGMRETLAASFVPACGSTSRTGGRLEHVGGSRPLFTHSSIRAQACTRANAEAIHPALDWLAEALSLRFQTCRALQFDDLKVHLRMAGEAAGIDGWRLRRALFSGGWLQPIENPLFPHGAVAAGPRTISWKRQGGRIVARIRGMLTKQERAALANGSALGDRIQRIADPSMPLSIGCLEFDLSSEERALEIASMLRLQKLLHAEAAQDVLGGLILSTTKTAVTVAPALDSTASLWDAGTLQWVPETIQRELLRVGSILRLEGCQRYTYYIKADTGYRFTDSLSWALLIKATCTAKGLGTISKCGDIDWAESLLSLPNPLSSCWMHFGGGVIGISNGGSYAFRGGNSIRFWEGITNLGRQLPERQESKAGERRALALSMLKGKGMRRAS